MQWHSDESFGSGSGEARVSAPVHDATGWVTYTIEGTNYKKTRSQHVTRRTKVCELHVHTIAHGGFSNSSDAAEISTQSGQ